MDDKTTPKKLLDKLMAEANDPVSKARAEGAMLMHLEYNKKARRYRETHREHMREYMRNYQRERRAKLEKQDKSY